MIHKLALNFQFMHSLTILWRKAIWRLVGRSFYFGFYFVTKVKKKLWSRHRQHLEILNIGGACRHYGLLTIVKRLKIVAECDTGTYTIGRQRLKILPPNKSLAKLELLAGAQRCGRELRQEALARAAAGDASGAYRLALGFVKSDVKEASGWHGMVRQLEP